MFQDLLNIAKNLVLNVLLRMLLKYCGVIEDTIIRKGLPSWANLWKRQFSSFDALLLAGKLPSCRRRKFASLHSFLEDFLPRRFTSRKIYFVANFLHDSCRRKEKHPLPPSFLWQEGKLPPRFLPPASFGRRQEGEASFVQEVTNFLQENCRLRLPPKEGNFPRRRRMLLLRNRGFTK